MNNRFKDILEQKLNNTIKELNDIKLQLADIEKMKNKKEQYFEKLSTYMEKFSPKCCMCKGEDWSASGRIFYLSEYNKDSLFSDSLCPVIPLVCTKCGNTIFINAIQAGIITTNENKLN